MRNQIEDELIERIQKAGFRVFIAESGSYGFYTDPEGSKVISFQDDLGGINFSGNYKSDNGRSTGTGWRITDGGEWSFNEIFNASPPYLAVGDAKWSYTTLDQHLATYQKSSKYTEQ